tara:strand:- start:763 stop:972 length:210 start_codon:yes stop_codon:yes gene_type:complete
MNDAELREVFDGVKDMLDRKARFFDDYEKLWADFELAHKKLDKFIEDYFSQNEEAMDRLEEIIKKELGV